MARPAELAEPPEDVMQAYAYGERIEIWDEDNHVWEEYFGSLDDFCHIMHTRYSRVIDETEVTNKAAATGGECVVMGVKLAYVGGVCPDCEENIPDNAPEGYTCENCGHACYSLSEPYAGLADVVRDKLDASIKAAARRDKLAG